MKNNKGFTMIEILVAIIIVGLLVALTVPSISKLMQRFRNDYYNKLELTVNEAGKDFFADNKIYQPDGILKASYVNIDTLIRQKYVENLLDYKGKDCSLADKESYTLVIYMGNGEYKYQTCIKCYQDDYFSIQNGTYCDSAWLTNENLGYDYGASGDIIYFYYGSSRESIREKLFKGLNVVKYNDSGQELERVVLSKTEGEGVLPSNIDEIENMPVLDSDNKKEYELQYGNSVDDNIKELTGVIYKHKAPLVKMTAGGNDYVSGDWTNRIVTLTLETNDNFFDLTNTSVDRFEWSTDGKNWDRVPCEMFTENTCYISFKEDIHNESYKFRIITNEGNISDESDNYEIKIDKKSPIIEFKELENKKDIFVVCERFNTSGCSGKYVICGDAVLTVSTNDEGSGIASMPLSFSKTPNSLPNATLNFPSMQNGEHRLSLAYKGINDYVRLIAYDYAGNSSNELVVGPIKIAGYALLELYYLNVSSLETNRNGEIVDSDIRKAICNNVKDGDHVDDSKNCTITYDANGGSVGVSNETVTCGSDVYLPNATRSGYYFAGWQYADAFIGGKGDTYNLKENITAVAMWSSTPVSSSYTLQLCPNGGRINGYLQGQCAYISNFVSLSQYHVSKEGNVFTDKWCTEKDGTGTCKGASEQFNINEEQTLYAVWTPNKYTIEYNANGGTGTTSSTNCTYGVDCIVASNGFSNGTNNFAGWEYNGKIYYPGDSVINLTTVNNDKVTFVAQWQKESVKYTVNLNPNKGSLNGGEGSIRIENIEPNTSIDLSTYNPIKTGYVFEEWCTRSNGTNCVGKNKYIVTANRTLYAKWIPNTYTIKYDGNGGTGTTNSISCTYGVDCIMSSNNFKKAGYKFIGWQYGGDTYLEGESVTKLATGGTITLSAQWAPITYTIKYSANGGTGTTGYTTCTYGENCTIANNNFTKNGYNFEGWEYNGVVYSEGKTIKNLTTTNNDIIIFTAKWDQGICNLNDSMLFGSAINQIAGNYTHEWIQYNSAYTCVLGDSSGDRYGGIPRVCMGDACSAYGVLGETAESVNSTYGCNFAKLWCTLSTTSYPTEYSFCVKYLDSGKCSSANK